jgi:hypothetical protein
VGQNSVHGSSCANNRSAASPRGALNRHDESRAGQPRPPDALRQSLPAYQATPLTQIGPQPSRSTLVKIVEAARAEPVRQQEGTEEEPKIVEHISVAHPIAHPNPNAAQTDPATRGSRFACEHRVSQRFQVSLSFSRPFPITEYGTTTERPGFSRDRPRATMVRARGLRLW